MDASFQKTALDQSDAMPSNKKISPMHFPLHQWFQLGQLDIPLQPTDEDFSRVQRSYDYIMNHVVGSEEKSVYGLHTGYGENERNKLNPAHWKDTQADLLMYLQVGQGEPLSASVVRRALKLQAIKVAYGLSSIHPVTYQALLKLANNSVLPSVPRKGSLGASGDLISMAHAVAPLFDKEGPCGPRDVIGLVNTNAVMAAWSIELDHRLRQLVVSVFQTVALTSIAIGAGDEHFTTGLYQGGVHSAYAKAGAFIVADRDRYLALPAIVEGEKSLHQARYSVRCAPQILGHCLDLLDFSEKKIRSEAFAVADNPLILETGPWHGGLFYAIGLAAAADSMMDVVHRLAEMLDRQLLILMDHRLNGGLDDNLQVSGYCHCKGIHQLVSALFQEIKAKSTPVRQMSFSCEGNNQDVVPCGMTALNILDEQLLTFETIVRGTMFCALRGAMMRSSLALPESLKLSQWDAFTLASAEAMLCD